MVMIGFIRNRPALTRLALQTLALRVDPGDAGGGAIASPAQPTKYIPAGGIAMKFAIRRQHCLTSDTTWSKIKKLALTLIEYGMLGIRT
jgi:hypothetical protein